MENHTKTATINPQIVNWGFLITNFQYICQGFIDSDLSADFPHLYLSFYPMKTIPNGEFGIPEVFSLSTKTDTIMFYTLYLLLRRKWEKEGRKEGKEGGEGGEGWRWGDHIRLGRLDLIQRTTYSCCGQILKSGKKKKSSISKVLWVGNGVWA